MQQNKTHRLFLLIIINLISGTDQKMLEKIDRSKNSDYFFGWFRIFQIDPKIDQSKRLTKSTWTPLMAVVSTSLSVFIVLGIYNFD